MPRMVGATGAKAAGWSLIYRRAKLSPKVCRCRIRRGYINGKLWLLNSGAGEFGWLDTDTGVFNPISFCPGYARGLAFTGNYAIIGLSQARDEKTFKDLPLSAALKSRDVDARCGLMIVDLGSGDATEWARIEGTITELFDISFLPGVACPSAIGLMGQEILKTFSIAQ